MLIPQSSTLPLDQAPAVRHDTSPSNVSAAKAEFAVFLSDDDIITDPKECWKRSNSERAVAEPGQTPAIVLLPLTTDHVSRILKICHRRRIPVTSFAGGTSSQGCIISTRGGVCIDFRRLNKILAVNESDMDVTVQPGVVWKQLDAHLRKLGFFFPPDPAPEACIGGMIATNAAGTNAYRYGAMKEWVISLTLVLADGSIVRTKRRPRKSSAGYDLTHLMIGSEGTLGLVTEAVLKITVVQPNLHVAIATFPDYRTAVQAGIKLANRGHHFDALEMLCAQSMHNINVSGLSPKRRWREETTLFLKMSGPQSNVDQLVTAAKQAAEEEGATSYESTGDAEAIEILWSGRKITARATVAMKKHPSDIYVVSDAAVPVSRLADAMRFSYTKLDEAGLEGAITTHLGDGNFHVKIVCPKEQEHVARDINKAISLEAVRLDGTISGEHGIGLEGRDELVDELGQTAIDMMRKVKFALDPLFILNCDKVVRAEKRSGALDKVSNL